MPKTLTFLHTSPVHIATFDRLIGELDPQIPVRHIVDESLLNEARAAGAITPELADRVSATIQGAAEHDAAVVLCTCSTIGDCAENASQHVGLPVLRVDRAMAKRAVMLGPRILVMATTESTFAPTRSLLLDAADQAGRSVRLTEVLCEGAWAKFEQGDQHGYIEMIAERLRAVASEADVIVLAQASMADAADRAGLPIPVLSSPRLGLEAALEAYYTSVLIQ